MAKKECSPPISIYEFVVGLAQKGDPCPVCKVLTVHRIALVRGTFYVLHVGVADRCTLAVCYNIDESATHPDQAPLE